MKRRNILITGASSGIGRGMAHGFAKQGYNLALCARRLENLEELKKELQEIPPPFMISMEKGSRLLVKAINREKANAYVPFWPWFFVKWIMPLMPLKTLRKF